MKRRTLLMVVTALALLGPALGAVPYGNSAAFAKDGENSGSDDGGDSGRGGSDDDSDSGHGGGSGDDGDSGDDDSGDDGGDDGDSSGSGGGDGGSSGSDGGDDDGGSDGSGSGGSGDGGGGNDDGGNDDGGNDDGGNDDGGNDDGGSGSGSSGSGSSGSGSGSSGSGSSGSGSSGSGASGGKGTSGGKDGRAASAQSEESRAMAGGTRVVFNDGSREVLQNGIYERIDAQGHIRERRAATRADRKRLQDIGRVIGTPRAKDLPVSTVVTAKGNRSVTLTDSAGWSEKLDGARYSLTDPNGNVVTRRRATRDDIQRMHGYLGM